MSIGMDKAACCPSIWTLSIAQDSSKVHDTDSVKERKMENSKTPKIVGDLIDAAQKEIGVTADNALASSNQQLSTRNKADERKFADSL